MIKTKTKQTRLSGMIGGNIFGKIGQLWWQIISRRLLVWHQFQTLIRKNVDIYTSIDIELSSALLKRIRLDRTIL